MLTPADVGAEVHRDQGVFAHSAKVMDPNHSQGSYLCGWCDATFGEYWHTANVFFNPNKREWEFAIVTAFSETWEQLLHKEEHRDEAYSQAKKSGQVATLNLAVPDAAGS